MTKLITDLLDVSKIRAGRLEYAYEPVEIDTLVQEIVETFQQTTTTHTITIEGTSHSSVLGDSDRLGQVVMNLITNAIKYSPQADRVHVTLTSSQDMVTISVQDDGVGIPKEHQQHIFEQFYRAHTTGTTTIQGLGMGLYISREIVERHKGKIWFESIEGQGSTFFVALPKYQDC